jgi:hypothetical protein
MEVQQIVNPSHAKTHHTQQNNTTVKSVTWPASCVVIFGVLWRFLVI